MKTTRSGVISGKLWRAGKVKMELVVAMVAIAVMLGTGLLLGVQWMNDPYRSLPEFRMDVYLEGHQRLEGERLAGRFRIDGELFHDEEGTRVLMVSMQGEEGRAALRVPPDLAGAGFARNQWYEMQIVVERDGTIQAVEIRKW